MTMLSCRRSSANRIDPIGGVSVKHRCTVWPIVKKMPRRFISKDGFGITPAGRAYFEPLVAGEAYPDYKNGMPVYTD